MISYGVADELKPAIETTRIKYEGLWVSDEDMTPRLYNMSLVEKTKKSCLENDYGGIDGDFGMGKASYSRWDGEKSTIAILSGTCIMGKIGFQNLYWVFLISEDTITELAIPQQSELWVTRKGILGVQYKDMFRGAPSQCEYQHFVWNGSLLVPDKKWSEAAKGELHFATCEPF